MATQITEASRVAESYLDLEEPAPAALPRLRGFPPVTDPVAGQFLFEEGARFDCARKALARTEWPLMWLKGSGHQGSPTSRAQVVSVNGTGIRRLESNGRITGSCWSDEDADYCLLAGILPDDPGGSRAVQTRQVLENIERTLGLAGMSFGHVVRTWLYLDGLLDWYDEFNTVRTEFFRKHGVFERLVPASTGIGIANSAGAALVAGALAVRPRHPGMTIAAVESPLQCSALQYRSSFSRAVELGFPTRRRLLISGTASIAPEGASLHKDDVRGQIALTMRVVKAILESRGMTWRDTVRAIAYFTHHGDIPLLSEYLREQGIAGLPVVNVHADVCRRDLLFEIELDAAAVG